MLRFVVPGQPMPWSRAGSVRKGGRIVHYTPGRMRAYQKTIGFLAHCERMTRPSWPMGPHDTYALTVNVHRLATWHFDGKARGDADNYFKAVADACKGILFHDDRCLSEAHVTVDCVNDRPSVVVQIVHLGTARPPKKVRALVIDWSR